MVTPTTTRMLPVTARAIGRLRVVTAAAARIVVVVGGGRRRGPQSHPDHRPPPGVDYTLDGRRQSGCRDAVPHMQLVVAPSTVCFVDAGMRRLVDFFSSRLFLIYPPKGQKPATPARMRPGKRARVTLVN